MRLKMQIGVRYLTIEPNGHWFLTLEDGDTMDHQFGFDLVSLVRTFPRLWRVVEELADDWFLRP